MKILVYNPSTNKMETYYRELDDPMPYSEDNYLTVREFRGSSNSDVLWTDRRAIEAFNKLRNLYGKAIPVGYAFKRIGEGGHSGMSQHYAGVAFDVGQRLNNEERSKLRNIATNYKLFTYVEPESLTPTWVGVNLENILLTIFTTKYYITVFSGEITNILEIKIIFFFTYNFHNCICFFSIFYFFIMTNHFIINVI